MLRLDNFNLFRYVRKKRLTKSRKKEVTQPAEKEADSDEDTESLEKIEKAKKKIELLLGKRKEIKQRKEAAKVSWFNVFSSPYEMLTCSS